MELFLTYDDIQLVPTYSEVETRQNISLETQVTKRFKLTIPIVASPMDTVCDSEMAIALAQFGGLGIIHRFMNIEEQKNHVQRVKKFMEEHSINLPIGASVGANGDYFERASELISSGANIILIDVAHGHHKNVKDAISRIKTISEKIDIIAGNIATVQAAEDLELWGADGLRLGVGGGALCTTRIKTGFGVPNVTCIQKIAKVAKVPVMADGGIKNSGDIAKALAIGASTVMLGSLLAGTQESPGMIIEKSSGLYKRYRGAASLETKVTHGLAQKNIEGESTVIPYKGGVKFILSSILDGVRSALSYNGANNLSEYNPEIVQITNAGMIEAKPHLIF